MSFGRILRKERDEKLRLRSTYTIRLNHRHKLFGHVFSGRYKALLVDGSDDGYLNLNRTWPPWGGTKRN